MRDSYSCAKPINGFFLERWRDRKHFMIVVLSWKKILYYKIVLLLIVCNRKVIECHRHP